MDQFFGLTLKELEKQYIEFVLDKVINHKGKASKILGINRRTLYRKERIYGLIVVENTQHASMEHQTT